MIRAHVEANDAAITKLRSRTAEIQRATAEAQAATEKAYESYKLLAYRRDVKGEPIEEAALADAWNEYQTARRRQNDHDEALAAVGDELRALEGQRSEAVRADAEAELARTAPAFETLSTDIDRLTRAPRRLH